MRLIGLDRKPNHHFMESGVYMARVNRSAGERARCRLSPLRRRERGRSDLDHAAGPLHSTTGTNSGSVAPIQAIAGASDRGKLLES
jgi:hypothetical protein